MLGLKPIQYHHIHDFIGTSYEAMTKEEKIQMISESQGQVHGGRYFELFAICDADCVVGFIGLCSRAEGQISCSPQVKEPYRRKGIAWAAETEALEMAKKKGYAVALAAVDEGNVASIALHEKLGFVLKGRRESRRGRSLLVYRKNL